MCFLHQNVQQVPTVDTINVTVSFISKNPKQFSQFP